MRTPQRHPHPIYGGGRQGEARAKIARSVHGRLRRFINWSNSMWVRTDPDASEFRPAHYDQRADIGVQGAAEACRCGSMRVVVEPTGRFCRRCGSER